MAGAASPDRDRAQVYEAECAAWEGTDLEELVPFAHLQQLANRLLADPWWPAGPVVVRPGRAGASSSTARWSPGTPQRVAIAAGQTTPATLTHELAHVLAGPGHGHGQRFRRAHVDLARLAFGAERSGWLRQAYHAAGLAVGEPSWPEPPAADAPVAL